MTLRRGQFLELKPFAGQTLDAALGYLRRDLPRTFADMFAVLSRQNKIGEFKSVSAQQDTYTATADVDKDTDLSIAIEDGEWLIGYDLCFSLDNDSGSARTVTGRARITGSDNIPVPGTTALLRFASLAASSGDMFSSVSRRAHVTVGSRKTFKVRIACTDNAADAAAGVLGASISSGLTNPDNDSVLWALRVGY